MPLFKCEHVGDIDHEHFFVQKVKFSLRLIPSFETRVQTSLRWICSNVDRHNFYTNSWSPGQLECILLLKQKHYEIHSSCFG